MVFKWNKLQSKFWFVPKHLYISFTSSMFMEISTENGKGEKHPYISLKESMDMADKIKDIGKATPDQLAKALGVSNAGWFRLKVASVKRWGLAEGHGELQVTQAYKDIKQEKKPNQALEVKRNLFFSIPMFKQIYEEYMTIGLPQEPYLTNAIADKFRLTGRNPNLVSNIIREFINEYFPKYGNDDTPISNPPMKSPVIPEVSHEATIISQEQHLPMDALFPIRIVTRTRTFDWDIKEEVDWEVVDSAIKSLKARWKNEIANSQENNEKS